MQAGGAEGSWDLQQHVVSIRQTQSSQACITSSEALRACRTGSYIQICEARRDPLAVGCALWVADPAAEVGTLGEEGMELRSGMVPGDGRGRGGGEWWWRGGRPSTRGCSKPAAPDDERRSGAIHTVAIVLMTRRFCSPRIVSPALAALVGFVWAPRVVLLSACRAVPFHDVVVHSRPPCQPGSRPPKSAISTTYMARSRQMPRGKLLSTIYKRFKYFECNTIGTIDFVVLIVLAYAVGVSAIVQHSKLLAAYGSQR